METLTDNTDGKTVIEILIRCGVSPKLRGFYMLADAVILYGARPYRRMTELYAELGYQYDCRAKNVCNYIAYAINHADGLAATLNSIFHTEYESYQMEPKLVVAMLSIYLRSKKKGLI